MLYIYNILLFLFTICMVANVTSSSYVVSLYVLLAASLGMWWYTKEKIRVPKNMLFFSILIFFLLLIVSSVGYGESITIRKTLQYILLGLSLIPVYIGTQITKNYDSFLAGIIVGLGVLVYGGYEELKATPELLRLKGYFVEPVGYAMMLEMALPGAIVAWWKWSRDFYKSKNIIYLVMALVAIMISFFGMGALILTQSRGAVGCLFLGITGLLIAYSLSRSVSWWKRITLWILVVASITGVYMGPYTWGYFERSYDRERVLIRTSSYQMWKEHKVFGVGLNNWRTQYQENYISSEAKEPDIYHAHNTLAHFFSTTGIVGGAGFIVFSLGTWTWLLISIWRKKNYGIACVFWVVTTTFIHGWVDIGIGSPLIMRELFAYLGVALGLNELQSLGGGNFSEKDDNFLGEES